MDKRLIELAQMQNVVEPAALLAFMEVETGGKGFDEKTGKLIIQFEPKWFKNRAPFVPSGKWSVNGVERQAAEWIAFNDAFAKNPDAAMQATSIGLGQIMGFHYKRMGFASVGLMWDDAKKGIQFQFNQLLQFINTDKQLLFAIKNKDWDTVARKYNGNGYKALARRIGREPYDISLARAYETFKKLFK